MSAPNERLLADSLPQDAVRAVETLASADRLLVASDFDGTMAPLVPVPADARPDESTVRALIDLSWLADTEVAVISGRSLSVLHQLTGLAGRAHLVGSHGLEFDHDFEAGMSHAERARLAEINRLAGVLTTRYGGLEVEYKPASTAIHYRHVDSGRRERALAEIEDGPCAIPGVHVTAGKLVVEVAAMRTSKGAALDRLRVQEDATAVVFLGDDVTDEDAFERLREADIGVKVGDGNTAAAVRIADTAAVARFLQLLALCRSRRHTDR